MSLGKWLCGFLQHLVTDVVLKRPITINMQRKSDGSIDLKTQITPSGASPTTHVYYGSGYPSPYGMPPYGLPMPPGSPYPPAPAPDQSQPATPMTYSNFPEDFQA